MPRDLVALGFVPEGMEAGHSFFSDAFIRKKKGKDLGSTEKERNKLGSWFAVWLPG